MFNVALIGKTYNDTIVFVDRCYMGETNDCNKIVERRGGIYNFFQANLKNSHYDLFEFGSKTVYIISDKHSSMRTSFVYDESPSVVYMDDVDKINEKCDWAHVSYVDDFESFSELIHLKKPYSLDFCTTKDRKGYADVMRGASIVFDSRERKSLYGDINIDTPIIFHDQYGSEVVQNSKTIWEKRIVPISGLNVNGAGDIYAGIFLEHYFKLGIFKSIEIAMDKTTNILREKNEKI